MSPVPASWTDDRAEGASDAGRGVDPSAKHEELGAELAECVHQRRARRHPRRLAASRRASRAAEASRRAHGAREASNALVVAADDAVQARRQDLADDPDLTDRADEGRLTLAALARWAVMVVILVAEVPLSQSVFESLGVAPTATIVMVVAIEATILAVSHHIGRRRSLASSRWLVAMAGAVVVATIIVLGAFRGVGLNRARIALAGGDPTTAPELSIGTAMVLFALIQFLFAVAAVVLGAQGAQSARLRPLQAAARRRRLARRRVGREALRVWRSTASEHRGQARIARMLATDAAAEAVMASRTARRWASYRRGALGEDPTLDFAFHRLGPIPAPPAIPPDPAAELSERRSQLSALETTGQARS